MKTSIKVVNFSSSSKTQSTSFKNVMKDRIYNNLNITTSNKIPIKKTNVPGYIGEIILNKSDRKFYGYTKTEWICLSAGAILPFERVITGTVISPEINNSLIAMTIPTTMSLANPSQNGQTKLIVCSGATITINLSSTINSTTASIQLANNQCVYMMWYNNNWITSFLTGVFN